MGFCNSSAAILRRPGNYAVAAKRCLLRRILAINENYIGLVCHIFSIRYRFSCGLHAFGGSWRNNSLRLLLKAFSDTPEVRTSHLRFSMARFWTTDRMKSG